MAELTVAELCSALIKFDTSNYGDESSKGERDAAEFIARRLSDAGVEPTLLEREPLRTNVIARIRGTEPELPAILVHAHTDVVPAAAEDWSVHPFSGEIRDGYVWGRGAIDMKDMCATLLSVVDTWAREGRRPRRDVVLAFVADEEDRGEFGAHWLVDEHRERFDGVGCAIGESGGFTYHAGGVRFYPIGTAERGTAHIRVRTTGRAGHASRRNDDNAVVRLIAALGRITAHEWPVVLTPTVREFLAVAGKSLGVDVGTDIDESTVDTMLAKLGSAATMVENTVRNSVTPTVLRAGYKVNVIPSAATAELDIRVLPGTFDELFGTLDDLLGPGVEREFITNQPPVQSPIDTPWFTAMADALRACDPGAVVLPYCLGGGTDAKAFAQLGIPCYGFAPLRLPAEFPYRQLAHGVDERVPVDGLTFGVEVLDRFLSG
ncbi:MAG: M20/M25/M40 family metallo-hydrolase [Sciscionella sp.]|nr:M20/M25/M40 family metallo-hydrolase [Sciscionella sp.]